jgi:hypothetical protein
MRRLPTWCYEMGRLSEIRERRQGECLSGWNNQKFEDGPRSMPQIEIPLLHIIATPSKQPIPLMSLLLSAAPGRSSPHQQVGPWTGTGTFVSSGLPSPRGNTGNPCEFEAPSCCRGLHVSLAPSGAASNLGTSGPTFQRLVDIYYHPAHNHWQVGARRSSSLVSSSAIPSLDLTLAVSIGISATRRFIPSRWLAHCHGINHCCLFTFWPLGRSSAPVLEASSL